MVGRTAMSRLRVLLLGPVECRKDDTSFGAPLERAVLAILALRRGQAVSIDELIDGIWGEDDPSPTSAKTVQVVVSRIRADLGVDREVIETVPAGYRLEHRSCDIDVDAFETALDAARALRSDGSWAGAADSFGSALALWRGPALMDMRARPFAVREAERLDELREFARAGRAESLLELGRGGEAVTDLARIVAERPLDESAAALYMRALLVLGRQSDALAEFHRLRTALRDQLGVDPGAEATDMQRRILVQDPALRPAAEASPPSHLPTPLGQLIGREDDVERLVDLVGRERLVTITGPGGVGKTRLALEAGRRLETRLRDGATFIDLSGVRDPALVATVLCDALLAPPSDDSSAEERLRRDLGSHAGLLILDNFEQVVSAAPLIGNLLRDSGTLRVLVTSRSPLHVRGEREFPLEPLEVAGPDERRPHVLRNTPAVRMLLDEIGRYRSTPARDEDLVVGAELARRLDGLPLALELVAAHGRTLDLAGLLNGLDDRLDLPAVDVDMPGRQRTLRTAVRWSTELLSADAGRLLSSLAVFVNGLPIEGARAVGGPDVDRLLDELVGQSLVRRSPDGRLSMLETVREVVLADSDQTVLAEARRREVDWLIRLLDEVEAAFSARSGDATAMLNRADAERANVRDALAWAAGSSHEVDALRLASAKNFWAFRGGVREGRQWLMELLERPVEYPPDVLASARTVMGNLALNLGDFDLAERLEEAALAGWRALGERRKTAILENNLAIVAERRSDFGRARDHAERALAILRELGDQAAAAAVMGNLGVVASRLGDHPAAVRYQSEVLEVARASGDDWTAAIALVNLALSVRALGDLPRSRALAAESLEIALRMDDAEGIVSGLEALALVAGGSGDDVSFVVQMSAALNLRERFGFAPHPSEIGEFEAGLQAARDRLGPTAYDEARQRGLALEPGDLAAFSDRAAAVTDE
jgi:predicted ATPase/DNA-binding SARP family transcriptional activator